jgi:hypothetical protein
MMSARYELAFDGGLLTRGFWLYVWEITRRDSSRFYYVGRTGDSSSEKPQSPFNRVCQHLGSNPNNAALRKRLTALSIEPEECSFRLVAYGPMLEEAEVSEPYNTPRDIIAALEKALADAMGAAGYAVINTVSCRKPEQAERFGAVRAAFAADFPGLQKVRA